jgi:hypothetical protein
MNQFYYLDISTYNFQLIHLHINILYFILVDLMISIHLDQLQILIYIFSYIHI